MSSGTQGHGRFIDVGGAHLYLEAWGRAGQPVLLCLHGLGGGTHFFGALGVALASQCRTVAIDLPGSGLSPSLHATNGADALAPEEQPRPSLFIDVVAELIVEFARTEHVLGPAVCVLGHSLGAILALETIRRSDDLAPAGLILVGGLPEPLPESRRRIRDRVDTIRESGIASVSAEVVGANFSGRSQRERPELTACFAKLFARQDPAGYAETASALAAWTARERPPLEQVPCLVVSGEEDRYAPPDAIRTFVRTLPAATRLEILRDCGHLPFLEQPETLAEIVSSFLRERCGVSGGPIRP